MRYRLCDFGATAITKQNALVCVLYLAGDDGDRLAAKCVGQRPAGSNHTQAIIARSVVTANCSFSSAPLVMISVSEKFRYALDGTIRTPGQIAG